MTATTDDHDGHEHDDHDGHEHDDHDGDVEPVTEETHDNSWSANLEQPHHADDHDLVVEQAVDAVEHTAPGYHVNLVTHRELGHPREYLYETLADLDGVDHEYVARCGCGGHVTRVHVAEAGHGTASKDTDPAE